MKSTVIFGNPGTGKTYDLVERIKKCKEQGYTEKEIQVLSHTRVAAQEIARRAEGALANTIHSLAYRYCNLSSEQVVTIPELKKFSDKIGVPMKGVSGDGTQMIETGDEYMAIINRACNRILDPEKLAKEEITIVGSYDEFQYFYASYNNWKNAFGMVDFNDMLFMALGMLRTGRVKPEFKVLFVDEAQDLSPLQWHFIDKLIKYGHIEIICVTGDPDQNLFSFGGADPKGMERFAKRYKSDVEELVQSYRVPKSIWKLSTQIINRSTSRYAKEYLPTDSEGLVDSVINSSRIVWENLHGKDVLVLYRTHALRKEMESEVRRYNVPYMALNGSPGLFGNSIGRSLHALEKIKAKQPVTNKEIQFLKANATEKCKRYLSKQDLKNVANLSRREAIIFPTYAENYYICTDFMAEPTIKFSTIHGAKGMEADIVLLLDGISTRVIENMEDNLDEELKVWFVAVTRSKNKLIWVNSMYAEGFKI